MPRIIGITCQKGGVGKTTTTVNLASAFSRMDKKTLVIDHDPQGNASKTLGWPRNQVKKSIFYLYKPDTNTDYENSNQSWSKQRKTLPDKLKEIIVETEYKNIWLVPSHLEFSQVDNMSIDGFEYILAKSIVGIWDDYDYIIIDTPPTLGKFTKGALTASTHMLVPIQVEPYALDGVAQVMQTLNIVQDNLNSDLKFVGAFLTMYNPILDVSKKSIEPIKNYFKEMLFSTEIPRTTEVSKAQYHDVPVQIFNPGHSVSIAYDHLAEEVIRRVEQ